MTDPLEQLRGIQSDLRVNLQFGTDICPTETDDLLYRLTEALTALSERDGRVRELVETWERAYSDAERCCSGFECGCMGQPIDPEPYFMREAAIQLDSALSPQPKEGGER